MIALLLALLLAAPLPCPQPHRSRGAVAKFRRLNPCPSTGKKTGACPGYVVPPCNPSGSEFTEEWRDACLSSHATKNPTPLASPRKISSRPRAWCSSSWAAKGPATEHRMTVEGDLAFDDHCAACRGLRRFAEANHPLLPVPPEPKP